MWTVPLFYIEPSTILVFGVEGLLLDTEPSMKRGINMDGSPPGHRTFHETGH